MRKIPCAVVAFALAPVVNATESLEVQARQVSADRFELLVQLPVDFDPQQAPALLQPVADQVCNGRGARLGRYSFESQTPLLAAPATSGTQTLTQQVECGGLPQVAIGVPAPETSPTADDERVVRANTLAYLAARDSNDFDTAHAMVSEGTAAMMRPENWRIPRAAFNKAAGLPSRKEVVRLTWYDDPAGAPRRGRYVAADYRGDYDHAGFYCGYVVWYLEADGTYRIVREEEGQMSHEVASRVAPSELAKARARIGCRD